MGQTPPGSQAESHSAEHTYSLTRVTVSGSKLFAEGDIVKATGLKIGSQVTRDDLNEAGNHLAQSGAFAQVSYTFDGRTAEYKVADAERLVPATFENFIWFADADLVRRVHDSVPLFDGAVPEAGKLADQVAGALNLILKEKQIQGQVVAAPFPAAGPTSTMQFRIEGVDVKVAKIEFPGAAPDRVSLLQTATKGIVNSSYLQSSTPLSIKRQAQAAYGKLGFLKVQFGAPGVTVVQEDSAAPSVAVQLPVQEGPQFVFAGMDWSGNIAVSSAELTKLIEWKPGTPADTTQLGMAIAAAKDLYGIKGYMYAQVKSTATIDAEKRTAVFHVAVDEGPLYRMGKLELKNLDAKQEELVRRVWEMKEGDVYDSSYPKTFLKKHPHELPSLVGWAALYTQTVHDDTLVVDLSLNFQKMQQ
jgi:outer membrane protein insertion porin family